MQKVVLYIHLTLRHGSVQSSIISSDNEVFEY